MTKIDGHTGKAATKQLNESLRRLQTDTIDLLQFHEIIRMSDPERIFAANGAFQAMLEAKKAGKIRYIGFTGHKSPAIHLKMLETCFAHNFNPATVQLPLNIMDAHYDSFQKQVLPVLLQRGIAPLGMKPMGGRHLLESKTVTPMECLHYAMNLPVSVVITGCDSLPILEQALTAARTFRSLSAQEVSALLAKTAKAAEGGRYELYKTTDQFDSTAHNPQWLG
jgi:diketogulonate reductase-like aldo/keto reductase